MINSPGRGGLRPIAPLQAALVAALAVTLPFAAHAQTNAPALAEMEAEAPQELPADPATIVTLQTENDAIGRTDRNYTAGLRLGITLPSGLMPDFLNEAGNALLGPGRQRISLLLSQTLFTPRNTALVVPNPNDRPYAAVLTSQLNLVHDTRNARTILGVGLGVIGPAAQGEALQNGFHNLIGETTSKGWDHQIKNMPVVQLAGVRVWRVPLLENFQQGLQADILPSLAAGVGTWRNYGQVGMQLRFGQGLDSDFGTSRVNPGLSGGDAYTPTRPFVWYAFVGADGQAIAYDATLNGNPFRSGPHVPLTPLVGELEFGFAVIYAGLRFSYTHVLQTQEFRGQRAGFFQFGSWTVAARF